MTKRQLERLADKLHRMAYELERDGSRLLNAGKAFSVYGHTVTSVASTLGNSVRSLEAAISDQRD